MIRTIEKAAQLARDFSKDYEITPNAHGMVSVFDIQKGVEKKLGGSIECLTDPQLNCMAGYTTTSQGNSRQVIVISDSAKFCWKRLTHCKELCQLMTDDAEVKANGAVAQIDPAMAVKGRVMEAASSETLSQTTVLSSEAFCLAMTLELLIPRNDRPLISTQLEGDYTAYDVAYRLKIPAWAVNYYFIQTDLAKMARIALA